MHPRPAAVAFAFYPGDLLERAHRVDVQLAAVRDASRPAPKKSQKSSNGRGACRKR